jgi:hypothetical protein
MKSDFMITPLDQNWMSFLKTKPQASIFHDPAWSQLLAEAYGYRPFVIGIPASGGELEAGVPMVEVNSFVTGKRWVSLPFSDYCYPLYNNEVALKQLMDEIILLAKNGEIPKTELRGTYPAHPNLYGYSEFVLHTVDLQAGTQKTFERMHEMHRRNIRIAETNNVKVVRGDTLVQLKEFYDLHLRTRRSQGVPVQPWSFFTKLKSIILNQGMGFILLAYKDQRCIAGAIFLHSQNKLTYKYGASLESGLKFRPNNLLMWTALQWGCDNGFTCLDLGRSSISNVGLRTFKSRLGAKETSLEYMCLAPVSDRGNHGRLTRLMERVLKKSPLWMCRLSGELLYKHFG